MNRYVTGNCENKSFPEKPRQFGNSCNCLDNRGNLVIFVFKKANKLKSFLAEFTLNCFDAANISDCCTQVLLCRLSSLFEDFLSAMSHIYIGKNSQNGNCRVKNSLFTQRFAGHIYGK
jgi:hypothetical protein